MLMPLIVVSVIAALAGLVMAPGEWRGLALVGVGVVAAVLALMAQAKAYQTEHMDTLRIQADALQKLLGKADTSGALTGAAAASRRSPSGN